MSDEEPRSSRLPRPVLPDAGALEVDVVEEMDGWDPSARDAAIAAIRAAYARAGDGSAAEVSLVLADNAFVRELNKTWRGKDKPTNVLSFPMGASAPGVTPVPLGDIVFALETVVDEAKEQRKTVSDHLSHLAVHGLLHLLGYDHEESDAEAEEMEALERDILASLDIADPYAAERAVIPD
ncbi:MAG: rRNA maturation RNase YbeY [Parvibaculaceae bacterium]|nr:rRNA maturation RNase YbeY [Parvibaculaceae bacterium]